MSGSSSLDRELDLVSCKLGVNQPPLTSVLSPNPSRSPTPSHFPSPPIPSRSHSPFLTNSLSLSLPYSLSLSFSNILSLPPTFNYPSTFKKPSVNIHFLSPSNHSILCVLKIQYQISFWGHSLEIQFQSFKNAFWGL